jgi:hypothetical protein
MGKKEEKSVLFGMTKQVFVHQHNDIYYSFSDAFSC